MDVAGEYVFDAPQALVWEALQDVDVLASVMPGGEGFEEIGENEYAGTLKVKVGPVQGKFKGNIQLTNVNPPESYDIAVDGKGAPGFVKASGGLKLTAQGQQTLIVYEGSARIGGRIASVGQRLMDASAKSIIRQSLEGLNDYLKVEAAKHAVVEAAEASGADAEEVAEAVAQVEVPAYKPPTQTSLAVNMAKDVAGDLIPPERRALVFGAIAVILVIIAVIALT